MKRISRRRIGRKLERLRAKGQPTVVKVAQWRKLEKIRARMPKFYL